MTTTKTPSAAELEDAVRSGDTRITAADIAAARAREHHEALLLEATSRAQIREADAKRAQDVQVLRDDIDAVSNDVAQLSELALTARTALVDLIDAMTAREATLNALAGRARHLRILPMDTQLTVADDSGIGWSGGPGTGDPAILGLDDRRLATSRPIDILQRLIHELSTQHRLKDSRWRGPHNAPTVRDQIEHLDRTLVEPRKITVRYLKRHGQHQPGTIAQLDETTARWAIDRGLAQPA